MREEDEREGIGIGRERKWGLERGTGGYIYGEADNDGRRTRTVIVRTVLFCWSLEPA